MKQQLVKLYNHFYNIQRKARLLARFRFRVLSPQKTAEWIRKKRCSVVRYGDGEFGLITNSNNPDFQQKDEKLAARLAEICAERDPRVLVCIPHNFKTTKDCNEFARKFWDWWIWENNNLEQVARLLKLNPWKTRTFGDAQITRPYMDWKDKSQSGERFRTLQSLWKDRDVLIVEGSQTKLGTGNDLLDCARSVERIVAPSRNAFSFYDAILQAAISRGSGKLVLIALGPTATVLAYDLAMQGIQALDIGHIDIEYEWYKMGATEKVPVCGKSVQEMHQETEEREEDQKYLSQIVERIE